LNFIFVGSGYKNIIIVGAVTSLVAATIALSSNRYQESFSLFDCVSIRVDVLALGLGAYGSCFHVITHFFKACLFPWGQLFTLWRTRYA
jgi:NADH-quinone oxidoreductase subunit L